MRINYNHLENKKINDLETAILVFDYVDVNSSPDNENDLLYKYVSNSFDLYEYMRFYQDFLHPASNEVRAILGHLSQYRLQNNNIDKNDLRKAYGHFRRLNIDLLKMLCDTLNQKLYKVLIDQYKYDLRNVDSKYLIKYSEKYIAAKKYYLDAQKAESSGSNRNKHNIFELYFKATKEFILLKRYRFENKRIIDRAKNKKRISFIIKLLFIFAGIACSIIGSF